MGAAPAVTRVSLRVECEPDAIAVSPGPRSQHGDFRGRANAAALERLAQNGLFESELCRVVRVLILATAAHAKVRARWRDPFWCGLDNLLRFSGCIAALVLDNPHAHSLARQRERHKHGLAFNARQKRPAVDRLFNLHELRGLHWLRRRGRCPVLSAPLAERVGKRRTLSALAAFAFCEPTPELLHCWLI